MTFIGIGNVWDARKNAVLCKFNANGIFQTTDKEIINRLLELGYTVAEETDMVSVELCNGINVDWKEKYDLLKAKYSALNASYYELKKQLEDIGKVTDIPINPPKAEEAEQQMDKEFIFVGDYKLPRDVSSVNLLTLKKFLRNVLEDAPDMRKWTKEDTIRETNKFLVENGYLD